MRSRRPHHGVVSQSAPTNTANLTQRTIELKTEVAAEAHDRREQAHRRKQDEQDVGPYQEPLVRRQNEDQGRSQRQLGKGLAHLVRKGNQIRRTRRVGHDVEEQESPHPADPSTHRALVRTGQHPPVTGQLRGQPGIEDLLRDVPRQDGSCGNDAVSDRQPHQRGVRLEETDRLVLGIRPDQNPGSNRDPRRAEQDRRRTDPLGARATSGHRDDGLLRPAEMPGALGGIDRGQHQDRMRSVRCRNPRWLDDLVHVVWGGVNTCRLPRPSANDDRRSGDPPCSGPGDLRS